MIFNEISSKNRLEFFLRPIFFFALGQFHMDICREEQVRQFPTTKFEKKINSVDFHHF